MTMFHHRICVECEFLELGRARNFNEDEMFGNVKLLLRIRLLGFFLPLIHTYLPVSHNLKEIESVGSLIQESCS